MNLANDTYPIRKESRMILESDILPESLCLNTQYI